MLVFVEGGKPENPEKNPRSMDENQQQTGPTYDAGSGNRTRATLVGSELRILARILDSSCQEVRIVDTKRSLKSLWSVFVGLLAELSQKQAQ